MRDDAPSARAALVFASAGVFAAVYVALDFNKLFALRYGADTGTFLQWLAGEAHGNGSWNNAEYRAHLGVHDSWALLALVPLLALLPYAQTLLVVQVAALAAAAPVLFAFARACGAPAGAAAAVAIAYLASPSAQGLAYGDFSENVFVPLAAGGAALAVARRTAGPALLCTQALLGLKEDQALFVTWFALCGLRWAPRLCAALAALAVLNGAAFVAFERLHHAAPAIPGYAPELHDPLAAAAFVAALFAPFAFAPLALGARVFLGAPLLAELTLNRAWAFPLTRIGSHWTASAVIAAALAAAYVVARHPRIAPAVAVCAALCALTINDTVLKPGRWPYIVDAQAYRRAVALRAVATLALLPRTQEGAYAVAAANPLVALAPYDPADRRYCPAYNTDARAFFSALAEHGAPRARLCGGVAVGGTP